MLSDVTLDLPVRPVLPALVAALDAAGAGVLVAPPGTGKTTLAPLAVADRVDRPGGDRPTPPGGRPRRRPADGRAARRAGRRPGRLRGARRAPGRPGHPDRGGHHRPAGPPAAPRPGAARHRARCCSTSATSGNSTPTWRWPSPWRRGPRSGRTCGCWRCRRPRTPTGSPRCSAGPPRPRWYGPSRRCTRSQRIWAPPPRPVAPPGAGPGGPGPARPRGRHRPAGAARARRRRAGLPARGRRDRGGHRPAGRPARHGRRCCRCTAGSAAPSRTPRCAPPTGAGWCWPPRWPRPA